MRLIDADQVYAEAYDSVHYLAEIEDFEFDAIINLIDRAPTVDAVPVVLCKDCNHCLIDHSDRENHLCMKHSAVFRIKVKLTDFCSFGERTK